MPSRALDRVENTAEVADALGVTLVHKGAPTLVASPGEGLWINSAGNSALAVGGTGDVLTGLAGGLLAQGGQPADAACVACFLHGRAGELAAQEMGVRGVIASDLFLYLGGAMIELEAMVGN